MMSLLSSSKATNELVLCVSLYFFFHVLQPKLFLAPILRFVRSARLARAVTQDSISAAIATPGCTVFLHFHGSKIKMAVIRTCERMLVLLSQTLGPEVKNTRTSLTFCTWTDAPTFCHSSFHAQVHNKILIIYTQGYNSTNKKQQKPRCHNNTPPPQLSNRWHSTHWTALRNTWSTREAWNGR